MRGYDAWKTTDTERERAEELAEAYDRELAHEAHRKMLNHKSKEWLKERFETLAREFIGGPLTLVDGDPTRADFIAGIPSLEAAMAADRELAGEPI